MGTRGDTVAAVQDCRLYLSRETVSVRSKVNAVIANKGEEKGENGVLLLLEPSTKMNLLENKVTESILPIFVIHLSFEKNSLFFSNSSA
jgi:hypothetical protein